MIPGWVVIDSNKHCIADLGGIWSDEATATEAALRLAQHTGRPHEVARLFPIDGSA